MHLSTALLVATTLGHSLTSAIAFDKRQTASLDAKFKAKGKKYVGTCADRGGTIDGAGSIIVSQFGSITPENSMKWDAIEPSRGQFSWSNADYLVAYAKQNNKSMRGHTLLWHSQLPTWVKQITDKATLTTVIQNHISAVAGRYKNDLYAWDVVNEILNEDGSLRDSVFSRVLGDEFVSIAFRAAQAAAPNVKRYINDYNLDDANYAKTKGMISKVQAWRAAGVPIDGIGSQSHLGPGMGAKNAQALAALAAVVPEVAITELDIKNAPSADYVAVFKGCLALSKCVGITIWGPDDGHSWIASSNPLLFDRNLKAKEAYNAVMAIL